ncbi:PTS sugar transporter subunit IIB [Parendozoicomonas haliclonae]|uniref:Oligo-beta-mannoside-specific phosphotransferase enzyme IIB component n=1 Tax=Parendozoicomonas haliclonae TaxID=1960125 RepID=A0A1X7AP90_9GAMM|nr:PTS sugar transporter subunit IIB [Parendozoicomonas haliclonae]SMA49910.1 Oligo-beta-mannoside-specific phosphotransferase enzyme IIB component [Parendozoicomonas haliclonae]
MKKIFLCCSAGMSTSMLVNKMKAAAAEQGIEADIIAVSLADFDDTIKEYDVCLLGPQVKFRHEGLSAQAAEYGKKVGVIDSMAYGMMKGDKVLEQALALLED